MKVSNAKNKPIIIIRAPVNKANLLGDTFFDSHFPIRTPTILELIKARELPRKTIIGFPDSAESISVAIWVLSPNSAIKTVRNVDSNKLITIYKKFFDVS